jgi:hypothetical protein
VVVTTSAQLVFRACAANSVNPMEWVSMNQVQRLEEREVAAGANLQELVGDGRATTDHPTGLLRVLEPHQAGLGQRVDGHDVASVALGLLQRGEHPGVVRPRVLAHDEDQVGVVDVVQAHIALADAEGLRQRGAAGLVAHVAAVRQVVGAERPDEELEQERGLVADPAGGVEERLVGRVERAQLGGEYADRLVPADRLVVLGAGPLDHRLGQPALLVEPVVRLPVELRDAVLPEEVGGDTARGRLVVDVLGAVFAVLVLVPLAWGRFRPRAARAVDAVGLVDVQQRQSGAPDRCLAQGVLQRVHDRGHPGGPGLGRGDLQTVVRPVLIRLVLKRTHCLPTPFQPPRRSSLLPHDLSHDLPQRLSPCCRALHCRASGNETGSSTYATVTGSPGAPGPASPGRGARSHPG